MRLEIKNIKKSTSVFVYDIFPRYPNLTREIAFEKIIMSKAKEGDESDILHTCPVNIPACTFGWENTFIYHVV